MKKLSLIMLSLAMLFVLACSDSSPTGNTDGDTGGDNTSSTITISGKITGMTTSANILANTTSNNTFYYKDGNIIAVAVNSETGDIYQGATNSEGSFSIDSISSGNYIIFFFNSAGSFKGKLYCGDSKSEINASNSNIDLEEIGYSGSKFTSAKSITGNINTEINEVWDILSLVNSTTKWINLKFYDGMDSYYSLEKNDYDSGSGTNYYAEVATIEYNSILKKNVRKIVRFLRKSSDESWSFNSWEITFFDNDTYYSYRTESSTSTTLKLDTKMSSRFKYGSGYTVGGYDNSQTFYLDNVLAKNNAYLDNQAKGFILKGKSSSTESGKYWYGLYQEKFGRIYASTSSSFAYDKSSDDSSTKMRIIYKKVGDDAFGSLPEGISVDFSTLATTASNYTVTSFTTE